MSNVIHEFGKAHRELVIKLDAVAGGSGFYGHPTTRLLADCYALGEEDLLRDSQTYNDPRTAEIRQAADKGEDTTELRKAYAADSEPIRDAMKLFAIAYYIQDRRQKKPRHDQALSLLTAAKVLLADLGVQDHKLQYEQAVQYITGIQPALIPTREYMERFRRSLLTRMGRDENASLGETAGQWRESVGLLSCEEMGQVYRTAAQYMLEVIKRNGVPAEADLVVETLKEAPWMGFFAYSDRSGRMHGETCMVESDTKCPFDVINTAAHEVGGHYNVHARWHEYVRRTGDLFPAVGVMASNQAVLNEGYANCAVSTFRDDLDGLFERIDLEKMDARERAKHLEISHGLEVLAMMSLGYEAARFFRDSDIDTAGMESEFIAFGVDPHRAASRARHITQAKGRLMPFCYLGPGYYPGMKVVGDYLSRHGKERLLSSIADENGPPSISTLTEEK